MIYDLNCIFHRSKYEEILIPKFIFFRMKDLGIADELVAKLAAEEKLRKRLTQVFRKRHGLL